MTTTTTPGGKKSKATGPANVKSTGVDDARRAKAVAAAQAAILKGTDLKPEKESYGPLAVVSSGSTCIDDLIGGSMALDKSGPKCPGYPRRRITEIMGAESSGKTTAALQAIAEAQKAGGWCVFIDFEHALDHAYAKKIGVSFDPSKLMVYAPLTMEQGWKIIWAGIAAGADLIVLDSVAAMVPEAELKKKPGEAPKIGAVASALSSTLPKIVGWLCDPKYTNNPLGTAIIFLNQMRASISTGGGKGGGANENSAGGNALRFFAYLRMKFTRIGSETLTKKSKFTGKEVTIPYGNHTIVKLLKSKVDGKQGYTTAIFIRFNAGIDDYYSMIEAAAQHKIAGKSGAFYTFGDQKFQGRDKFRTYLMANQTAWDELRKAVLVAVRNEADETEEELDEEDDLLQGMSLAFEEASNSEEGDDPPPVQTEVDPDPSEPEPDVDG